MSCHAATMEEETKEGGKTSLSQQITFYDGDACRYPAVRAAAAKMGWRLVKNSDPKNNNKQHQLSTSNPQHTCNVLWVDASILADYFLLIQPWQVINHFPGMINIARKTRLAQNLEAMRKAFPTQYNFSPQTYALPKDLTALRSQHFFLDKGRTSKHVWIMKPDGGAKGKGIFLTRDLSEIQNAIARSNCQYVAQRYIARPMLIDNKKFDLRLYVLITSCDPLRVYLFRDGLCRLCTVDFVKPVDDDAAAGGRGTKASSKAAHLKDRCAHLTNYSVNKRSETFVWDDDCDVDEETGDIRVGGDCGSKRSVSWLLAWLRAEHGEETVDKLWCAIGDICAKTILSILPTLVTEYRATFGGEGGSSSASSSSSSGGLEGSRSFEILGFDILLDNKLQPYLIEVNHLPSFGTDAPLDKAIKRKVIEQAMSVVRAKSEDRRLYERSQRRKSRHRLVSRAGGGPMPGRLDPHEDGEVDEDKVDEVDRSMFHLHRSSSPQLMLPLTAEAVLTSIYRKYCPEKLDKVPAILIKYRGYEDWLITKVRERYCNAGTSDDGSAIRVSEGAVVHEALCAADRWVETGPCRDNDGDENDDCGSAQDNAKWSEEERLLKDYDRIYPPQPSRKRPLPKPPYEAMKRHVFDESAKQVERLTIPLYQSRANGDDEHDENAIAAHRLADLALLTQNSSRADYFFSGSLHLRRASGPAKIRHPPTKRQLQSFDRLSRGYHANDNATNRQDRVGSTVHNRCASDPFTAALPLAEREASLLSTKRWELVKRVRQELDEAKMRRQRNEGRSRLGVQVRPLDLNLGKLGQCVLGAPGGQRGRYFDITNTHQKRSRYMTH